jgi:hypothetical protein
MASKKKYALYTTNASNHNSLITCDAYNRPFLTELDARLYAKNNIKGCSVFILSLSKDIELIKH